MAAGCSPEKFGSTLELLNSGRNRMINEIMNKFARSQQLTRQQPPAGSRKFAVSPAGSRQFAVSPAGSRKLQFVAS
jgi:hypothetical protein